MTPQAMLATGAEVNRLAFEERVGTTREIATVARLYFGLAWSVSGVAIHLERTDGWVESVIQRLLQGPAGAELALSRLVRRPAPRELQQPAVAYDPRRRPIPLLVAPINRRYIGPTHKANSWDRLEALRMLNNGLSTAAVARHWNVSCRSIYSLVNQAWFLAGGQ